MDIDSDRSNISDKPIKNRNMDNSSDTSNISNKPIKYRNMDNSSDRSNISNKPIKYRNMDMDSDRSNISSKPIKYRNIDKKCKNNINKKSYNIKSHNKQLSDTDSWNLIENYDDHDVMTVRIGDIIYYYNNFDNEFNKFMIQHSRRRNNEILNNKIILKKKNYKWISNNYSEYMKNINLNKLLMNPNINFEYWDLIYNEFKNNNYDYKEFLDLIQISETDDLNKQYKNLKRKIMKIKKLKNMKNLNNQQKEKIKHENILKIKINKIKSLLN